jgi:hypothetical protein
MNITLVLRVLTLPLFCFRVFNDLRILHFLHVEEGRCTQAVSRWLPTAAVRGSKPDLGMWDLWWDKVALGRFSSSSSVSPAIVVRSTNYSTITLIYHPGKMYNRPICGCSTGAYTNLGDLQRDLMGVKSHPTKLKKLLRAWLYLLSSLALHFGKFLQQNICTTKNRS